MTVGTSPEDFVTKELPAHFARLAPELKTHSLAGVIVLNIANQNLAGQGATTEASPLAWSITVQSGELVVKPGALPNKILTLSVSRDDFQKMAAEFMAPKDAQVPGFAVKLVRWDDETTSLVRSMPGSVLLRAMDGEIARSILLSPGERAVDFAAPECSIECSWSDLVRVRRGEEQPMELFLAGKIKLSGDAQLALALAGLLV